MTKPHKISVREFIESVGRDEFQSELGRSTQLVTRAITDNEMPAHWFIEVRDWAAEKGKDTPEYLFKWSRKTPAPSTQNANCVSRIQGQASEKTQGAA